MGSRSTDSLPEYLNKMMQLIGEAKLSTNLSADDLAWIIDLESSIVAKAHQPIDAMLADPETGLGALSAPPLPGSMGPVPGGGMGGSLALGRRAAGPMGSPMGATNPDELRRMLATSPVQGG